LLCRLLSGFVLARDARYVAFKLCFKFRASLRRQAHAALLRLRAFAASVWREAEVYVLHVRSSGVVVAARHKLATSARVHPLERRRVIVCGV
jgi:hypothetical protein